LGALFVDSQALVGVLHIGVEAGVEESELAFIDAAKDGGDA
jgi:hypothetical protein